VLCALVVFGVGCAHRGAAGSGEGGEAAFSISYPDTATSAKVGEHFNAKPEGRCNYENGREARWTMSGANVASGALPPGMDLEAGVIGGVPTQAGTFAARIELTGVTCAGKQLDNQAVDVSITVK
jgi:hypothetical protein